MASITSAGVGSGLDLERIIKASVDAEDIPKLQSFAVKKQSLQVELSAVGEIKSAISQLEGSIKKLADIDNLRNVHRVFLNQVKATLFLLQQREILQQVHLM